MNLIDVLIMLACVFVVIFTIALAIINKKKGKSSCGCDCSNCSKCSDCNMPDRNKKNDK